MLICLFYFGNPNFVIAICRLRNAKFGNAISASIIEISFASVFMNLKGLPILAVEFFFGEYLARP